ncbi:glycosyltransferase family 2 protein [Allomuricauda sp. NBRC 101325]|uniref:glycosyltransferase family 2 protein n=1 Tax=Allomuricauda sp. NBRC 101325 TaxID=1113758 RepID=UPI00255734DB|nr:glycosyltransferase [Muricauda sp. NBRC 101325]
MSIPKKPNGKYRPTVDVLTTYYPGEPYNMTIGTLEAIQKITYPHTTYLCDEANDPFLKEKCEQLGVVHVTRNNRINAKAGNINNALKIATGEIALVLDPDHVPNPDFLDRVVPYFADEKIGFVQVVQGYYNKGKSLVARGAAEQTFHFYGPMMMTMNSHGTVQAIGANCTFRRSALDSIGGHAPGLAEDMHTSMLLHAKGWKSVYVPSLLAKGMAPLDLTSYYKQQLKWSRGVFELLFTVYPKIFKDLSTRQKFHYGLLPMHYLIGFIYLLSFAIPIVALFTSKMPWTGNFLNFLIISLPILMTSFCIRVFVQKWVMEKNERGFHVIGGLLQIITWWVFILGVVYTFVRKKVPYLPTPKQEEETNLLIIIPNLVVALLSIAAIWYGLNTNITPFSIAMMVFAAINTLIMLFSLYLATRVTNKNHILRSSLTRNVVDFLVAFKQKVILISDYIFRFTRTLVLPLAILALTVSNLSIDKLNKNKWENIEAPIIEIQDHLYKGIFLPTGENGLSDVKAVDSIEKNSDVKFDMVSYYMAWGDTLQQGIPSIDVEFLKKRGGSIMITWEPWLNAMPQIDSLSATTEENTGLALIGNGNFDPYIKQFAKQVRALGLPVFLRFAHEFDNPGYPWFSDDKLADLEFVRAWRRVHDIFESLHVDNVKWVWNPWKPDDLETFYPGDPYVDYMGVDLLNYGALNTNGNWHNFEELYLPYQSVFKKLADKPVLLSEFGSLDLGGNQTFWLKEATEQIVSQYREIKGIVFFNSRFDKNFPDHVRGFNRSYLDWSLSGEVLADLPVFSQEMAQTVMSTEAPSLKKDTTYQTINFPSNIRGAIYSKGDNWVSNNYVANKNELEKDFKMMLDVGINTIGYRHSEMYDHNVMKYSKEIGIDVLFSFWIPSDIDFVNDGTRLEDLRKEILETVTKYKDQENIIGWNFSNDVWQALSDRYHLDALKMQRQAYHSWLRDLLEDVKNIDPVRPIAKDVAISQVTSVLLEDMKAYGFKIDAYKAIVENPFWLNDFSTYMERENMPFIMGGISVQDYKEFNSQWSENVPILLSNWQNRWESHAVSFDGLLDFKGNKTPDYFAIKKLWTQNGMEPQLPEIRILKPSVVLKENHEATYNAIYLKNNTWQYFDEQEAERLQWLLCKKDVNGNDLAIKFMGQGPKLEVKIPEDYKRYTIVLTYIKDGCSKSSIEKLNTPLH